MFGRKLRESNEGKWTSFCRRNVGRMKKCENSNKTAMALI